MARARVEPRAVSNEVLNRIEAATSILDLKELLKEAASGKLKAAKPPISRVRLNDIKPSNR